MGISTTYTRELIREWKEATFTLRLYDIPQRWSKSQHQLAYELFDSRMGAEPIFVGNDYGCSPMHSIDGNDSVAALLSFLSLKPGDTDSEYFDDYSARQLEWMENYAEELSMYVYELENPESDEE